MPPKQATPKAQGKGKPSARAIARGRGGGTHLRRTLEYLSICKHPDQIHLVLKHSPNSVAKSICNAAANMYKGSVRLTPRLRRLFQNQRKIFDTLATKSVPITTKRNLLIRQKGRGFGAVIPILISTALSALGSAFFSKR